MKSIVCNRIILVLAVLFTVCHLPAVPADENEEKESKRNAPVFNDSWDLSGALLSRSKKFREEPFHLELGLEYEAEYENIVKIGLELKTDYSNLSVDDSFLELFFFGHSFRFGFEKAQVLNEQRLPGKLWFFPSDSLLKDYVEDEEFIEKTHRIGFGRKPRKKTPSVFYSLGVVPVNSSGVPTVDASLGFAFRDEDSFIRLSGVWLPQKDFFTLLSFHIKGDSTAVGFETSFGTNPVFLFLEDYYGAMLTGKHWIGSSFSVMRNFSLDDHTFQVALRMDGLVPELTAMERYILHPEAAVRFELVKDLHILAGIGMTVTKFDNLFHSGLSTSIELKFKP